MVFESELAKVAEQKLTIAGERRKISEERQLLSSQEERLALGEEAAGKITAEKIPQRKYQAGVTRETQKQYVKRREQASQYIQEAGTAKSKIAEYKGQLTSYEAELAASESSLISYETQAGEWQTAVSEVEKSMGGIPFSSGMPSGVYEKITQIQQQQSGAIGSSVLNMQNLITNLQSEGYSPVYSDGRLSGFEDLQRQVSVPLQTLPSYIEQYSPSALAKLEAAGVITAVELPQTQTQPFLEVRAYKSPNILQRLISFTADKNIAEIWKFPFYEISRLGAKYETIEAMRYSTDIKLFGTDYVSQKAYFVGGQSIFTPELATGITTYGEAGLFFNPATIGYSLVGYGAGSFIGGGKVQTEKQAAALSEMFGTNKEITKLGIQAFNVGLIYSGAKFQYETFKSKAINEVLMQTTSKGFLIEGQPAIKGKKYLLSENMGLDVYGVTKTGEFATIKEFGAVPFKYEKSIGDVAILKQEGGFVGYEVELLNPITKQISKFGELFRAGGKTRLSNINEEIGQFSGKLISEPFATYSLENDINLFSKSFGARITKNLKVYENIKKTSEVIGLSSEFQSYVKTPKYTTKTGGWVSDIPKQEDYLAYISGIEKSRTYQKIGTAGMKIREQKLLSGETIYPATEKGIYNQKIIAEYSDRGIIKVMRRGQTEENIMGITGTGRKSSDVFYGNLYNQQAALTRKMLKFKTGTLSQTAIKERILGTSDLSRIPSYVGGTGVNLASISTAKSGINFEREVMRTPSISKSFSLNLNAEVLKDSIRFNEKDITKELSRNVLREFTPLKFYEKEKLALKQKEIFKYKQLYKEYPKLSIPKFKPFEIPKTPFIPKFYIPSAEKSKKARKVKTKSKSKKSIFYSPDFTAATLNIKSLTSMKELEKMTKRGFTGLEIRPIIK